jgi:hypothetical protein
MTETKHCYFKFFTNRAYRQYQHWTGGRDKRGFPICMFDIAHLNRAVITDYNKPRGMKCPTQQIPKKESVGTIAAQTAMAFHDTMTRFVLPLCSAACDRSMPDVPITSAIYIVDVSALGLKQAWNLRSYAQDVSELLATCFPEVVQTIFVSLRSSPRY